MKPGWQTTEFWVTLLVVLIGATLASGLVPPTSAASQALGILLAGVKAVQYGLDRTTLKVEASRTARAVALGEDAADAAVARARHAELAAPLPPGGPAALLVLLLALGLGGCGGWAAQVKGDLDAVMPQCSTEAAITACQCASRVLRDRQCQRGKAAGGSLPPACREQPASQPAPR